MNTSRIALDTASALLAECSEAFGQIAAVLKIIKAETKAPHHVGKLAGAALHIAENMADGASHWSEEAEKAAKEAQQ